MTFLKHTWAEGGGTLCSKVRIPKFPYELCSLPLEAQNRTFACPRLHTRNFACVVGLSLTSLSTSSWIQVRMQYKSERNLDIHVDSYNKIERSRVTLPFKER